MKCIFCQKEINVSNQSAEHIIPRFLGGNYVLDNVCKKCNNEMGSDFEGKLGNNIIIQFLQAFYLLKRRKSKKAIVPNLNLKINNMAIVCDDEGHMFYQVHPRFTDDGDKNINAIFDARMSRENSVNMLDTRVSRLNKKNNRENLGYDVKREVQKLEQGQQEELKLELDMKMIFQLFCKIAYEFASKALGSDYLNDEKAVVLRNAIQKGDFAYEDIDKYVLEGGFDKIKLQKIIEKVLYVLDTNTRYILEDKEFIYPSDGNFKHALSLDYNFGKLTADINLFDVVYGKISLCDNISDLEFENGELIKLVMGIKDNEPYCKVYSDYIELKNKFDNN